MGYYSNVAIGMSNEDAELFMEKFKARDEFYLPLPYEVYRGGTARVYYWEDVKWYSGEEDVALVEAFLEELREDGKPVAFARVGEDIEDAEYWYSDTDENDIYNNLFWIQHSISFNCSKWREDYEECKAYSEA